MIQAKDLKRFMDAMSAAERTKIGRSGRWGLPFVTISRQAGAGGHQLAQALLALMEREQDRELFGGWQIFDQLLAEKLLEDKDLNVSMESLLSEEYHSQIQEFVRGLLGGRTDQYLVMRKMFETIRTLATVGKVIIVGRGGSQVTKKLELGVHMRLVAPEPMRVRRMMTLLHQNEEQARKSVHQQDRDRARLLKSYFQADIDDPLLYDVTWNTAAVELDTIAAAILTIIRQRLQRARAQSPL